MAIYARNWKWIFIHPPTKCRGYTGFTRSVCPSVRTSSGTSVQVFRFRNCMKWECETLHELFHVDQVGPYCFGVT